MHFKEITVSQDTDSTSKGRTFTAHLVAYLHAEPISPASSKGTLRPVLLAYAGSPSTLKAFSANLRSGRVATTDSRRFELLRSAGYRYLSYRPNEGQALVIAYLPQALHLQPGAEARDHIQFVSAPPRWWLDQQEAQLAPEFGSRARDHAHAAAFVARVDARSPLPIANHPNFHRALYHRALGQPWVTTLGDDPDVFKGYGIDALGLEHPILCSISHSAFADFLAPATSTLLPEHLDREVLRPRRAPTVPLSSSHQQLALF